MLQSHLMEMMSLLTMNMEKGGKLELLNSVAEIKNSDVLIGQYQGYLEEVLQETGKSVSRTPTFAVAKLGVKSPSWKSVPIWLSSGKRMDERVGYARVVFKTISSRRLFDRDCSGAPQVIFYVGHGSLGTPAILIHKSLPLEPHYVPLGWLETNRFHNATIFGAKANCFRIFIPVVLEDAYSFLIEQLYDGNKKYFVANDSLIQSWKIWSPVLKMKLDPKIYSPGILSMTSLGYETTPHNLQFVNKYQPAHCLQLNLFLKRCDTKPFLVSFLQHFAVIGPRQFIITKLSEDLELAALADLDNSFHVALSGGSSPLYLYDHIVRNRKFSFPWDKMNIWQVDERCSIENSNFQPLSEMLLRNVPIDSANVHPMLAGHACSDTAAQMYQRELENNVCSEGKCSFHFTLLGVGSDGHTASIFPYDEGGYQEKRYVIVVNVTASNVVSPQRMTLTLKAINESKHIAVLVIGKNKCSVLKKLSRLEKCCTPYVPVQVVEKFPICGVFSSSGVVRWYIEEDLRSCME